MSEKQILNALTRPRSANNKKNEEERGKKIRKIGRKIVFLDSFLLPPSYKTMT